VAVPKKAAYEENPVLAAKKNKKDKQKAKADEA